MRMSTAFTPVGIALGSNLGDRAAEIDAGFAFLQSLAADGSMLRSTVIETAPVDCPPGSAPFLNAVAEIEVDASTLPPARLHARLKEFEGERGRLREARNSPRPLDLDLLYFGDVVLNSPDLVLPHPRAAQRRFVLEPLAELRPGLRLPGQTRTVRELLEDGVASRSVVNWGMTSRDDIGKVEQLAYRMWEREGRPEGRALAYWIKAERLLSDDAFLNNELEVEVEEGGIVPRTQPLPPSPFPPNS
jgi:2-amino-4-hydroxy-6-hydroxymethyldihydropteridine diphosphokinase